MDEDVLAAGVGGEEAEALVRVVPGHRAVGAVGGRARRRSGRGGGRAQRQHVLRLRSPLPLAHQVGHPLAGGEHAAGDHGGAVHEHLRAAVVGRDEAVPLARLVPGDAAEHAERGVGRGVPGDPDVARLRAAVPLADLELHGLALAQQPRPAVAADDLGGVDEQVLGAVRQGEEAEASLGVEPADGPLGHGTLHV